MRYKYRITKYDPAKRNLLGHYLGEEWTSISDLGKTFCGHVFTQIEYTRVEATYLETVSKFLSESRIETLTIDKLEMHQQMYSFEVGQSLKLDAIQEISRLSLREILWCQLRHPRREYLHFGYDFYMYIGVPTACPVATAHAQSLGLFVEPWWSPYLGRFPRQA
jgi:hypothetical protein